jgi:hypothetical protein
MRFDIEVEELVAYLRSGARVEGMSMSGFERLDRLSLPRPRGGASEGKQNGNYRHDARTKALED